MSELPKGARFALIEHRDTFFKRERPIVNRLASETHSKYLNVMVKIENIFSRFRPVNEYTMESIYDDHVFGQWNALLQVTLYGVIEFDKKASVKKKNELNEYSENIVQIHRTASKLANLLRISEMKGERLGCCAGLDVSAIGLLVDSVDNIGDQEKKYRFNHWLRPEIENLRRFDLKYWPTVIDIIEEVGRQAEESAIHVLDGELPKQIHKNNTFLKYFFGNLFEDIERKRISVEIYEMADSDWCWFFNTAFGEQSVNEYDMKNFRNGNKALFLKG